MSTINSKVLTDDALNSYDKMMIECVTKIEHFSPLATAVWTDVLRELEARGFVQLISGSYSDLGNALIRRLKS